TPVARRRNGSRGVAEQAKILLGSRVRGGLTAPAQSQRHQPGAGAADPGAGEEGLGSGEGVSSEEETGAGAGAGVEKDSRPNIVVVVLESTSGLEVGPGRVEQGQGLVSPWVMELSRRGMHAPSFYSAMPNTNKAMFQVMCGLAPSLETSWVEFDNPELLGTLCLPNLLRVKMGYESLFLTGSSVGGLGALGFDKAIGFAG
ncbi:unnamed protein product, partial [Discosporangium mesarthrocarpum]